MQFDLPRKNHPNMEKYSRHELETVQKFSNLIYKELGALIRATVLFGSNARKKTTPQSDIDVLIVLDDLTISLAPEVTEAYRLIVQKAVAKTSSKLHITTLRFTAFWDYMRNGDPIGLNILRDGVAIIDTGIFEPMQALLKKGRIRPTKESVWNYFARAPNTLHNSKWHMLQATIDLYWAVIDSAHAVLMQHNIIPPTPEQVADLLDKHFAQKRLLQKKYVTIMRHFYKLMKMITHREINEIKGEEFDRYYREAEDFVKRMKKFIEFDQS